ncbi:MAG: TetR/AcrR family transcriptional regulator [Roseburia sp.]
MKETDKRYEANRQVKLKIARALTKLMDTKAFSDISVTDIIATAGVARASYYRNFHSKEEVLIKITDDIMEEYRKRAEKLENDFFSYEAILLIFRYFKTYKKFILSVYKAGLAYIYLDLFDQELENHMGDMPYNDIHRYKVYFYSGALYNVFLKMAAKRNERTSFRYGFHGDGNVRTGSLSASLTASGHGFLLHLL